MLHISKLIDNAKEIKSQIGSKTQDIKVTEYFKKISAGLDIYPKTEPINNIVSLEIEYWELLLEKRELLEVDKKRFKKLALPVSIDITTVNNLMSDILSHNNNYIEEEQSIKEIENLVFARALFFYISNLLSIKEHKNTYDWTDDDFKLEIKTIPEDLNFIKNYIKEIGHLDFKEMCHRYSKVVSNVKKAEYIQQEIEEYSRILKTQISLKDWKYLDEHFVWSITGFRPEGFDIDDIRNIHGLLMQGDFYLAIFKYEIGLDLTTLLLTTEMYIEFLQSQISNAKSLEDKSTTVDGSLKGNTRVSVPSFSINTEKHEVKGKGKKEIILDLKDMMASLKSKNYIDNKTNFINFRKVFLGEEVKEKIIWIGRRNQLKYFIDVLYEKKLEPVKGKKIWHVAHKCFDVADMVDIVDEKGFSASIRKGSITEIDKKQLNACINHLRIIK